MSIHEESIVIDAHCDTLLAVTNQERLLTDRSDEGNVDLPRLRKGGVTAQVFAIFVEDHWRWRATVQALRMVDTFHQAVDASQGQLRLATKAVDIERAKTDGCVAGILSLEGAEPLDGDLGVLRQFRQLGVRGIGLTWNHRNQAADGVAERRSGGGLTEFGVALVKELNRLGMWVDIAHLAPQGVKDVLAVSQAPVVASHANAHALCAHPRNLTDEQLKSIAATGGVVGVTFYRGFVAEDPAQASIDRVIDHIEHMASVIGVDHVGLGSDFDGFLGEPAPVGLEDVTCLPQLTAKLESRGLQPGEIRKILGDNFLRVIRDVLG